MPKRKKLDVSVLYFSPRLWQRLQGLLHVPLACVQAPSGYGKTTAVRAMLSQSVPEEAVHWFTVLEDEDLLAGWRRFARFLAAVDENAARQLLQLDAPSPKTLGAIAAVLQGLSCKAQAYVVIDNFQHWAEQFPADFIDLWQGLPGGGLHVVLLSQPLAGSVKLLANRAVCFVGQEYFALNETEIRAYFSKAGLVLAAEEAAAIQNSTEGWMAAVYLHLLQMAEGAGSGMAMQGIYGLMREFVWQRLDEQARHLLLMLSLFHSFTGAQVLHLLQAEAVPPQAAQVFSCRGFVRYDAQEKRYYFHAILLALLREIFAQQGEGFQKQAQLAAGEWSEKTGNKLMAVACYHAAAAYRQLFALALVDVELHTGGLCTAEMIEDILAHCPQEVKREHPLTLMAFCYELFSAGRYEAYVQLCGEIAEMLPGLPLQQQERNELLGELTLMQSFAAYNDIEKMSACHQQAYALIKGRSRLVDNTVSWAMGCPSVLYMYHRSAGQLENELEHMEACLPAYTKLTDGHGSGGAQIMRAEALLCQGHWDEAQASGLQGAYLAQRFGQGSLLLCASYLDARAAALAGDMAGLAAAVRQLDAARESGAPSLERAADMALGQLWCVLGQPGRVAPWLAQGSFAVGELPLPAIPFAQMVHLQYCLGMKDYTRLYALGELFIEDARQANNLIPQIVIPILLASAHYRSGGLEDATAHLAQALQLALPDRLLLPFAEYGEDLLPLMGAMAQGMLWQDLPAIRAMADRMQQAKKHWQTHDGRGAQFSLTPREHEVALLAAKRRSNKEIAEMMGVSVATVRTHLQAVYGKLGIDSALKSKRNLLEKKLLDESLISYR